MEQLQNLDESWVRQECVLELLACTGVYAGHPRCKSPGRRSSTSRRRWCFACCTRRRPVSRVFESGCQEACAVVASLSRTSTGAAQGAFLVRLEPTPTLPCIITEHGRRMDEVSSSGEMRSGRAVALPQRSGMDGAAGRGGRGGKRGHHGRPLGSSRNRTGYVAARAVEDVGRAS